MILRNQATRERVMLEVFPKHFCLPCLMLIAIGCGQPQEPGPRVVYPARGTATFRGRPIPDATVRLHPIAPPSDGKPVFVPRGRVGENGEFVVTTYRPGDGAPAGEYGISLSWQGSLKGIDEELEDRLPERLPRKYTSPRSSGLKVVITKGDNQLPEINIR